MKLARALENIRTILVQKDGPAVVHTVAVELSDLLGGKPAVRTAQGPDLRLQAGVFIVGSDASSAPEVLQTPDGAHFRLEENGSGLLVSTQPNYLYTGYCHVVEDLLQRDVSLPFVWRASFSFPCEKSVFDLFLNQYARQARDFDRERYIREYARLGFTHLEVNSLASLFPYEQGLQVPGEFYPDFYTYAPALDQFVSSRLNRGLYPEEYLQANLNQLKAHAQLALKYGLTPGLLCFEPRSVPEVFFQKYPTLRGPRVDHPFRSFRPRFSLTLVHPLVRRHYAELVTNLLREVPELEFLSVWSNDSGSGFEHTKSLYVGRNGGPYLIREWKDDEEIARSAASNIARFFRLLRDAASAVNPRFRVGTRLESFYGERKYLWPELADRIDPEVNSLLTVGWENNYPHPRYPDIPVLNTALHNTLREEEAAAVAELEARGSRAGIYHFFASHANHEPLLGIPFPWLVYEKLLACRKLGVKAMAHMGGINPPDKAPYAVNQEVFRLFQLEGDHDVERAVEAVALRYVGPEYAPDLVRGWRSMDEAVRAFVPMSLYSSFGSIWQRLFVRPLVPDIERIPEEERAYYERFMCTAPHNPNKVDLARDVLFELISRDYALKAFKRIDENVWPPLEKALSLFGEKAGERRNRNQDDAARVFEDQHIRARALRCYYETLRNTAVWVYAVHEYLDTSIPAVRVECRKLLSDMIERELGNSRLFLKLWEDAEKAGVEWMIVSGAGETPFLYGENFPDLLRRRMTLMEKHRSDEPFIDPDYMFRVEDDPYGE